MPLNRADGSYVWSTSFGFQEQVTHRKAQSVINAAYCTDRGCDLLWDGRADQQFKDPITEAVVIESGAALESQALIPLLNDTEMSSPRRRLGRPGSSLIRVPAVGALAVHSGGAFRLDRRPRLSRTLHGSFWHSRDNAGAHRHGNRNVRADALLGPDASGRHRFGH